MQRKIDEFGKPNLKNYIHIIGAGTVESADCRNHMVNGLGDNTV